jgi:L-malate glycosyltransferase
LRLLHLHSSFHAGGKELRAAQLINAFGYTVAHSIVSGVPDALGAASAIDKSIATFYPKHFPSLIGRPTLARLKRLAEAMRGYDLILTYNWGAMDAVMAHALFARSFGLPPLVHHEDGFNEDEATKLKWTRNLFRRLALARTSALVVPSERLEAIALGAWQQPRGRVNRIANGINTSAYARKPRPDALPGLVKRPGDKWLGTLAGLRPVKNLPRLVRAFAPLPEEWQLVIAGEGPEREAIMAEAARLGVAHRVHLPGFVAEPARAVGLYDLFALSSDSEQFPISVVEAMAAGLAIVSPRVGDVVAMVAPQNRPFIVSEPGWVSLGVALAALAGDPELRTSIGKANQIIACQAYDEQTMVAAYRDVYANALGQTSFP